LGGEYFRSFRFLFAGLVGYLAYVSIFPSWLSAWLHKLRGVKIGRYRLVYIAPNVLIDSLFPELVTIGDNVYITRGAKIIAHTNLTPELQALTGRKNMTGAVTIGHGAFIGVNAIVLPDVTIGNMAIVGAGAVVTKSIPDYAIAVGNPAKVVGDVRDLAARRAASPQS
jgi:acetyltransferase-like isoleucine patch superfamily enzyme